jgi:short-subunit dehydrogenase
MAHFDFKDKVVIITGGSRGIGRELARQLAARGAWLCLAARDEERLKAVQAECEQLGGKAVYIVTDVCEQAQCERLIRGCAETYGRIDALVNNAGVTMWARFDKVITLAPFETIMQTNYFGGVYCTYNALPHLKQSRGMIVGISSLTGLNGVPTRSAYAASKHAMAGFFDTLRIELAETGVSVTIIYPGFVKSEVRARAFGPDGNQLGTSPVQEGQVMPVETCARIILRAMERRKREEVMTLRGKLGLWLKLIAPGLVDRIALRAIQRGR